MSDYIDLDKYSNKSKEYILEVARSKVTGVSSYNKFGSNIDVDTSTTPEDVWGGSGVYTGFNATSGEAIKVLAASGVEDGTLVSSGTATGGTATTLEDTGATFVTDGVAVGDLIINDTQQIHGVVSAVTSETVLTVLRFLDGGNIEESFSFAASDTYRVATAASTGSAVVKLSKMLESDYDGYKSEYIIMNGDTPVDTIGTDYIRCSRMLVVLAGSNGTNANDLQARQATTAANVFCYITANTGQSIMAGDTIPKGKSLYITDTSCRMARANGSAGSALVEFRVRQIGQAYNNKINEYITNSIGFISSNNYILSLPEYTDFIWRVSSVSDNNTQLSAQINGFLIDNE